MEPVKHVPIQYLRCPNGGSVRGSFTIGELLEHGDLGVGTLDSIDGELIVLDGKAYQAKGSGDHPEIVKFLWMPRFLMQQSSLTKRSHFRQRFEMTDEELEARIESYYDGKIFSAPLRFIGDFAKMHVRMIQNPHQR